jgi:hypothetical protein
MFELIKETEFTKENGNLNVDYYHMDHEAMNLWFDYNGTIEDMIAEGSELSGGTKSAYSKMATYFSRFILLIHILDSVYVYPFQKLREAQINVGSVEKAIRLVKYFMFQYELVSKEVSSEKEAKNILFDTKGMTISEKVKLLHTKDPNMSQRALAKHFSISLGSINKILNS